jgi:tetratricopeptide (TPR) repeat protein
MPTCGPSSPPWARDVAADPAALTAAIRRHEERLDRDPESLSFAQLADLYRKAGRTAEAVAVCRRGLVRFPHYTTARLILAKAYMADGDFDAALAELGSIMESSPKDVESRRLAAEIHRRFGRIDAAVALLEAAVRLDPGDRESRSLLGLLRATVPTADAAGVARLLTDDTFVTTSFGSLCLEQGLLDEAVQVFTRILRKNPDDPDARDGLEQALRGRVRRRG